MPRSLSPNSSHLSLSPNLSLSPKPSHLAVADVAHAEEVDDGVGQRTTLAPGGLLS